MTTINPNELYNYANKLQSKNVLAQLDTNISANRQAIGKVVDVQRVGDRQQDERKTTLTDVDKRKLQQVQLNATVKHVQDTTTVLKKADGALEEIENKLERMKEITEKLQDEKLKNEEQKELREEFEKRKKEIAALVEGTDYNSHKLIDGSLQLVTKTSTHGGTNESIKIEDMGTEALGIEHLALSSMKDVIAAFAGLDEALSIVSNQRSAIDKEVKGLAEIPDKMRRKSDNNEKESLLQPLNNPQEASKASANVKEQMLVKKEEMYKRFVSMFKLNPSDVFQLLSK